MSFIGPFEMTKSTRLFQLMKNKQTLKCGNHQILTHFRLDILHQLPLTKLIIIPAQLKQSSLSATPGVLFQNRSYILICSHMKTILITKFN